MIKRYFRTHWFSIVVSLGVFILFLVTHDLTDLKTNMSSIASCMVTQSIIVFCMTLCIITPLVLPDVASKSEILGYYKLNNIRLTIIFSSTLITMLRGILLLDVAKNNYDLAVVMYSLVGSLIVFQFLELINLIVNQLRAKRVG